MRKRQIEDEINTLRSSRNQLIGESIPETQPVHEPRQYQTSQFLEALRENSKSADIILISSDGKEIHAHSPFLNDSGYFLDFIGDAKFFTNLDAESLNDNGKCTLNFTDSRFDATTINHFLDLKYGIPLREKLTQTQIINLLYFSRYVLDESLKDEMLIILFKDLNIDNSETLLPGLFNVVLDFTDDLAKQFTMFNKFKNLLSHVKPSIKLEWFELLSQHEKFNNPSIHYWLGFCYERGIGVEIDKETAFITWLRAGEQHYALAQFAVGDCYFNGHGVEKDLEMSFYWNTLAADQGYGPAQHDAGWKYMRGEGVEKNFEKAFHRFKLAADQGYGPAQCSVEQCYHFGYGVEKNFEEAIRWSCKVVNQNSTQGLEVLSSVWKYQY